jgi:hypothetical protein
LLPLSAGKRSYLDGDAHAALGGDPQVVGERPGDATTLQRSRRVFI